MGQGQSQQTVPTELPEATGIEESSAAALDSSTRTPSHSDSTATATTGKAGGGGLAIGERNDEAATEPDPTHSGLEPCEEPATASVPETFKVPGLPARPPQQVGAQSAAVPADIAHIMALGANEPEKLDAADLEKRATVTGSREIAEVVRELKTSAAMAVDNEVRMGAAGGPRGDELVRVEQEMEMRGIQREPVSGGIEQAEEGEVGADVHGAVKGSAANDVKMDA